MGKCRVGSRAEIIGHEDGFWNFYFAATVLRDDCIKFLVRYEELKNDEGEKLEEELGLEYIRPYPPKIPYKINELDDVDAFDGCGWWRGTVVHADDEELEVNFGYVTDPNEQQLTYNCLESIKNVISFMLLQLGYI
ncbi:hypothetical protein LXL04_012576 [Taraxacum kok-saghyz]